MGRTVTSLRTEIVRLWREGHTYLEIAMTLRCSRSAVAGHIYRHRNGMGEAVPRAPKPKPAPKDRKGKRGPNRATDPATRAVVDAIYASKAYDAEITEAAGLGHDTIRKWRNGTRKGQKFLLECVREALTRLER